MVEAIEDLFVPVLIYNNKKGKDAEHLRNFEEPSWNNPVTRFLNGNGTDVIERKDGVWQIQGMADRMAAALKAAEQDVPRYLSDLAINDKKLEIATFAMHCYWVGEAKLGSIAGVTNTLSGWAGGLEVVQVTFDPQKVDYVTLLKTAQSFECASKVFAHNESQLKIAKTIVGENAVKAPKDSKKAKLSDQKYHLRNTASIRNLPLTTYQSTKINSLVIDPSQIPEVQKLLSPRQRKLLTSISTFSKSASANSMEGFVFPEDDSKLPAYLARLLKHVEPTKALAK